VKGSAGFRESADPAMFEPEVVFDPVL